MRSRALAHAAVSDRTDRVWPNGAGRPIASAARRPPLRRRSQLRTSAQVINQIWHATYPRRGSPSVGSLPMWATPHVPVFSSARLALPHQKSATGCGADQSERRDAMRRRDKAPLPLSAAAAQLWALDQIKDSPRRRPGGSDGPRGEEWRRWSAAPSMPWRGGPTPAPGLISRERCLLETPAPHLGPISPRHLGTGCGAYRGTARGWRHRRLGSPCPLSSRRRRWSDASMRPWTRAAIKSCLAPSRMGEANTSRPAGSNSTCTFMPCSRCLPEQ
jgi:hypothetical protein